MVLVVILIFSTLGSVGAILTAGLFLKIPEKTQETLIPCLLSYASGTLLAAALLGLIPHALEHTTAKEVLFTVMVGILLFFLLERLIVWRHCHKMECEVHAATGSMILIGDAFHNAVDGVLIAASFLVSIPVGIVTSLSVITHEIAQEVGDFAILLHDGYSKRKALILNLISSLWTLPGAIIAFYALEIIETAVPYVMAISAASFLYIALTDLYPELQHGTDLEHNLRQFLLMVAGVGTILVILQFH